MNTYLEIFFTYSSHKKHCPRTLSQPRITEMLVHVWVNSNFFLKKKNLDRLQVAHLYMYHRWALATFSRIDIAVHILGKNLRLHVADLKTEESTEFRQDISIPSQFIKKKTCAMYKKLKKWNFCRGWEQFAKQIPF